MASGTADAAIAVAEIVALIEHRSSETRDLHVF